MSEEVENKKKWYVVRAISGKEKKAKEYIENVIVQNNLQNYVSQVLIPMEKVFQIRKGKKINKEKSFFPGYILIEAELLGEVEHTIRNLPGVLNFLSNKKGVATPLRKDEVRRILGKVDELSETEEQDNPFEEGEAVKVIDGPFSNFNGIIEDVNKEKKKLKVMVKIFGRKTPLELSFLQVEKN